MSNLLRWLKNIVNNNQQQSYPQNKIKEFSKFNKRSILEHIKIFFNKSIPDMLYPGNFFWNLKEEIRFQITGWDRDLIWCPSQLTKIIHYNNNWDIILYARWRWNDPWTGKIIFKKKFNENFDYLFDINPEVNYTKSLWSKEILEKYNFNVDSPIRDIELALEQEYKYFVIDKKEKLYFNIITKNG